MSLFCANWLWNTYTYRKHWSHFVHAVAISSLTDISDFLWVSRQFQLLVDELGKSLHAICTATNTHKLWVIQKEREDYRIQFSGFWSCISKNILFNLSFTNLNISKHFWKIVSPSAQAEVVENVLFHGVQVGIFYLDLLSKNNLVLHINKWIKHSS